MIDQDRIAFFHRLVDTCAMGNIDAALDSIYDRGFAMRDAGDFDRLRADMLVAASCNLPLSAFLSWLTITLWHKDECGAERERLYVRAWNDAVAAGGEDKARRALVGLK